VIQGGASGAQRSEFSTAIHGIASGAQRTPSRAPY
jgi:hypothetical protein